MTVRKDDSVYRVIINILPEGVTGPEWTVQERKVCAVHSNGDIVLAKPFEDLVRKKFESNALGMTFFVSPAAAVRDFTAKQHRSIEAAQRKVDEANRAIKWAESWGNELARQASKDSTDCVECARIAEEDGDILPPACEAHGGKPQ